MPSITEHTGTGTLIVVGEPSLALPLKSISVNAVITGIMADVEVEQVFQNPHSKALEVKYLFPLVNDATVYDLELQVGDRIIKGKMKEKAAAAQRYEQAKSVGDGAALMEQERPDLFTTKVANILPEAIIKIRIRYAGVVPYEQGRARFVVPLTFTPPYCPATMSPEEVRAITPEAMLDSEHEQNPLVHIEVALKTGIPLSSYRCVLHQAECVRRGDDELMVTVNTVPDRDFILQYDFGREGITTTGFAYCNQKPSKKHPGTFGLVLIPPLESEPAQIAPREFIFVLDRSGSMGNFRMDSAKSALRYCLRGMREGDRFQIVAFDDQIDLFASKPLLADENSLLQADMFLEAVFARGGTMLNSALKAALSKAPDPKWQRLVVILTDGGVGNEDEIFQTAKNRLGEGRIYVFSIGMAPNRHLVESLSTLGRGFARYIPHSGSEEAEVSHFLTEVERPLLIRPSINWPTSVTEIFPESLPELSAERPLLIFGRYTQAGNHKLRLTGQTRSGVKLKNSSFKLELDLPDCEPSTFILPRMWARAAVQHYLDREAALGGDIQECQDQVIKLACKHRIMSPYTSFVAVEERSDEQRQKSQDAQEMEMPPTLPGDMKSVTPDPFSSSQDTTGLSYTQAGSAPANFDMDNFSKPGPALFSGAQNYQPAMSQVCSTAQMSLMPSMSPMSPDRMMAKKKAHWFPGASLLLVVLLGLSVLIGGPIAGWWIWWKPLIGFLLVATLVVIGGLSYAWWRRRPKILGGATISAPGFDEGRSQPKILDGVAIYQPQFLDVAGNLQSDSALRWLALNQRFDGTWDTEPMSQIALATGVLALIAGGNGEGASGPYRPQCSRAGQALISSTKGDDFLALPEPERIWLLWASCEFLRGTGLKSHKEWIVDCIGELSESPEKIMLSKVALLAGLTDPLENAAMDQKDPQIKISIENSPSVEEIRELLLLKGASQCPEGYHKGLVRQQGLPDALATARLALDGELKKQPRALLAFF